jgi:hypothetical protein
VLTKLHSLKDAVETHARQGGAGEILGVTFLSDTIVIGVSEYGPEFGNVQELSAVLLAGTRAPNRLKPT